MGKLVQYEVRYGRTEYRKRVTTITEGKKYIEEKMMPVISSGCMPCIVKITTEPVYDPHGIWEKR